MCLVMFEPREIFGVLGNQSRRVQCLGIPALIRSPFFTWEEINIGTRGSLDLYILLISYVSKLGAGFIIGRRNTDSLDPSNDDFLYTSSLYKSI